VSTPLQAQSAGIPLPQPTPESAPFWEGCARGELLFQRCAKCGTPNFVPAAACRNCLSPELSWEASAGKGSLYSWTIIWRPQTPAFEVPYAVGIVDIDEGYQMLSAIIDCDADDLRLGLRLEVDFRKMSDEITLPYFRPAAS
jgi:uncharacterized OB-fold protein